MPFSLKNTGVTYQRLVNLMFKDVIGKSMEVYVDDMLFKFKMERDHIEHLNQMFNILRKYRMKLNPPEVCLRSWVGQISKLYDKLMRDGS